MCWQQVAGYGLISPILTQINEDIGPSPNILWVGLANLVLGAITFLMVGQLSDIFGRRWWDAGSAPARCEHVRWHRLARFFIILQIVSIIYYGRGEISEYDVGTLAGLAPMSFVFAQMCHGPIVWFTGPKWAMIGSAFIGVGCLTACAADIDNRALTQGLLIVGCYAIGIVESVSITTSTFPLRSQEEIGQGGGLSGSTRNFVSAISLAVYTTTLSNRLNVTIPARVYAVATGLGLPTSSLAALGAALRGNVGYDAVPGITDAIRAAVQEPYRLAFRDAAKTVFLVSLAFSGTALILSFVLHDQQRWEYRGLRCGRYAWQGADNSVCWREIWTKWQRIAVIETTLVETCSLWAEIASYVGGDISYGDMIDW
jgi:MFS family permease